MAVRNERMKCAWGYRDALEFHYPTSKFGHAVTMHWWDGLNDGVPYTKEFVNKYGIPCKREHLNIPPRVDRPTDFNYRLVTKEYRKGWNPFV